MFNMRNFSFGLYLLSFISNTVIILLAPKSLIKEYVIYYNTGSIVFSYILFIYFSKFPTIRRSSIVCCLFCLFYASISAIFGIFIATIALYPGILILVDYLVTQSHTGKTANAFRVLMILTAVPFFWPILPFVIMLPARALLILSLGVVLAVTAKDVHRLSVRSPVPFIIGNYLFYNGTLLALTFTIDPNHGFKLWYLAAQLGLVGVLKLLDYSLRKSSRLDQNLVIAVLGVSFALPVLAFVFHPNIAALGLFAVGFCGLISLRRFIDNDHVE